MKSSLNHKEDDANTWMEIYLIKRKDQSIVWNFHHLNFNINLTNKFSYTSFILCILVSSGFPFVKYHSKKQ